MSRRPTPRPPRPFVELIRTYRDDPRAPDRSFMVQRLRLPVVEVVCRSRFFTSWTIRNIVVCDGMELCLDNSDVQLGERASAAAAGFLELLEPVNKYAIVEEVKWRPLREKPSVSPPEFTRLALEAFCPRSTTDPRRIMPGRVFGLRRREDEADPPGIGDRRLCRAEASCPYIKPCTSRLQSSKASVS